MDFAQSIYWHQGLFLQPQHFQLMELAQHFQRKPLYEMMHPHFWGVGQLELAPESLGNRSFEVRNARLIFKGNTYVEFPGNAVIGPRSFDKVWTSGDMPLDVYLGLRKVSRVVANVTVIDSLDALSDVTTRFISMGEAVDMADLYSQGPSAPMPTLQHCVKIFFGSEIETLNDYDLIPIAQLVRDNDIIRVVPRQVPPCYALSGSQFLTDVLQDIRDDIAGRLRQIDEYKIPRDMHRQELDPDFLLLLQAIQALSRLVPRIVHLTETSQIDPWSVYSFLRECVGELSTFSARVDVLGRKNDKEVGIPPYDHLNLGYCFSTARQLINELLGEIMVGPEFRVFMEPRDAYLVAALPQEFFADRSRFYLVTRSALNNEQLSQAFLQSARLAAPEDLSDIINLALPGIELIEVLTPPQGLPQRPGTRYYRIEQISQLWDRVGQCGELGMYWRDAPEDLRSEIVVLRG